MAAQLGLGTVQFGLPYGITNTEGQTPTATVGDILAAARSAGVTYLDTAAAYGDSENVLGSYDLDGFRIVTKTPQLRDTTDGAAALTAAFERSLERLRRPNVEGLLVHNANDLLGHNGERIFDAVCRLRDSGRVRRIGTSLYTPTQVDTLLDRFEGIDLVQVPLSAIDQRLLDGGQLARLSAHGITIHVRSAFLQGLLLLEPRRAPSQFDRFRPQLQRWWSAVTKAGTTPLGAALAFVRDLPGVEAVIVGVATLAQFRACVAAFADAPPFDGSGLGCDDEELVDPTRWTAA